MKNKHKIKSSTRENDAIKRSSKWKMYEAAAETDEAWHGMLFYGKLFKKN